MAVGSTGILCASDGTLYVSDVTAGTGVLRTISAMNPAAPAAASPWWEPISALFPAAAVTAGKVVSSGGKIWVADNTAAVQLLFFEDTTVTGPALSSPSSGTALDTQTGAVLRWEPVSGATMYVVRYNQTQFGWSGATTVVVAFATALNIVPGTLVAGADYHWRVCVRNGAPALSGWSDTWTFTTAMGAGQWTPGAVPAGTGPAAGATDQPLKPAFQWNPSVAGTTGYEFEVSTSSATDADGYFASTVVSKVGASALTTTVYTCDVALSYSTAYVWHVRAITATGASNWFTATFSTMAEPVEAPAPTPPVVVEENPPAQITVEVPPAEAAPTPGYIWAIIGIGAVLVVVVLVLVWSTRRIRG